MEELNNFLLGKDFQVYFFLFYNLIFNFIFKDVTAEMSIWENVVVTPLEKAYCKEDMEPYYGDQTNNENKNDVLTTATAV